ncbi:hypothetical protein [Rhodococcus qingshengii]|uniref:hypothetical protein n=1 Tax=Rhodococcus qingshengii TaxID=334542 RepID=UPI00399D652C
MEIRDAVERLRADSGTSMIFGEPHQTSDGSTIITVFASTPAVAPRPDTGASGSVLDPRG